MTAAVRGTVTVADRVVRKVAAQAAREAVTGTGGKVTKTSAAVRGHSATASVGIALAYRGSADEAARAVQEHVANRTAQLTGLQVPAPRISVHELIPRTSTPALTDAAATVPAANGAHGRRWSERRLPVCILGALALGGVSALLQDAAAVHLLGSKPAPWRRQLFEWLTGHGPATTPAWSAAAVVAAGLWMIVLALTPGRRRDLVMSTPGHGVRVVISRRSAGHLIRGALTTVPGITGVHVRVGRRRLMVRAELVYGERSQAREHVMQTVESAVRGMSLAVAPRTRVRVRPGPRWQPTPTPHKEGDLVDESHA